MGEQGAADRWTALDPFSRARARGRRGGIPPRRPLSHNSVLLSRPSVFPLQREMRRAFPMLAVLGAMRPIGPVVPRWRSPVPGRIPPRRHIPPPWPSRGRDAKPLSRQALLIGELGAARRSAGCRGGTAANGRCLRAGGPSPAVRDTCPIAPRRSPRRCPARLFCRRIWAVCDSRPECPGLRAPPPIRRHGQWAPPACAARAWGRARVPGSRGMVPMGCRRRRAGRLLALTAPLMPI